MADARADALSGSEVIAYLIEEGVLPAEGPEPTARALGGGVSNDVFEVRAGETCLVVKRPYPNLAVEDDWPADVARVHNEAAAARAYERLFADASVADATVPSVVFEDDDAHAIGIECAPGDARMWKAALLDGVVDPGVAETLGRALGVVHAGAAGDRDLEATFDDPAPFEQLRLDPYHRTVARRHPDVADAVEAEIDRIEGVRRTLVHGDYSPKNVLVAESEDGPGGETGPGKTAWILDFEVAHWGDPAFDLAFMCNHLLIKSVHNADRGEEFVAAARRFIDAYEGVIGRDPGTEWEVETPLVRELGVLMLARVDGKSPVEYTDEPTESRLRAASKRALTERVENLDRFLAILAEERDSA
ncbi:MAG: phosphotransferase family protein [Halobacteriales archaeon]